MAPFPYVRKSFYADYHRERLIYVALILRTGLIKIGFTRCLRNRMEGLKSQFRSDIQILGVTSAGKSTDSREYKVHQMLRDSWAEGQIESSREVYHVTQQVQSFIDLHTIPPHKLFHDFPAIDRHTPYHERRGRLTPEKIHAACDDLIKRRDVYGHTLRSSRSLRFMLGRIRREHAAGHDMTEALAIVRDRLNITVELPGVAGEVA